MRWQLRALLWSVLTISLVTWALQTGGESYDREFCAGDVSDCDLGVFRGALWGGLALLVIAVVVTATERWLMKRRRHREPTLSERVDDAAT